MIDAIGNDLHKGDLVHIRMDPTDLTIGEVVELHEGGMVDRNQKVTPSAVTVVMRFTIGGPPHSCRKVIKVQNPEQKPPVVSEA